MSSGTTRRASVLRVDEAGRVTRGAGGADEDDEGRLRRGEGAWLGEGGAGMQGVTRCASRGVHSLLGPCARRGAC